LVLKEGNQSGNQYRAAIKLACDVRYNESKQVKANSCARKHLWDNWNSHAQIQSSQANSCKNTT